MFAKFKKNALKLVAGTALLIMGAMGVVYAFPAQIAGVVNTVATGFRSAAMAVAGVFRRRVDVTTPMEPMPAA